MSPGFCSLLLNPVAGHSWALFASLCDMTLMIAAPTRVPSACAQTRSFGRSDRTAALISCVLVTPTPSAATLHTWACFLSFAGSPVAHRSAAVGGPCSVPGRRGLEVPELHQHPSGCIPGADGLGNTERYRAAPFKKELDQRGAGESPGDPWAGLGRDRVFEALPLKLTTYSEADKMPSIRLSIFCLPGLSSS